MKIDGSLLSTVSGTTGQASARQKGAATTASSSGKTGQESVSLSGTSSKMQALETSINQSSGFDAAKVEAIKQAISQGSYSINPEKIADSLLASVRELVAQ